jgi:NADPH:quinone reductase-like Zn-dependent oxidoreductase
MIAAYAEKLGLPEPLDGLVVGERPDPEPPPGWEVIDVRAATLNHHDLWTLKGVVGVPFEPPLILGCDAAGVTADGREVVVHSVISEGDDFRMLTDGIDGSFAPKLAIPSVNLIPKPESLSFAEAACLPTAWLTAYRMLFTKGGLEPGQRVLVQGATGGVSTAAVMLAAAAGIHVTVTSRREEALERAKELGAHEAVSSGARLPYRVDVVIETVGKATWSHSLRSLAYGGKVVVAGATTGGDAGADLNRVFWRELQVLGSMMGTAAELRRLVAFVEHKGIKPPISQAYDGVEAVPEAMAAFERGEQFGKLVINIS